MLLWLCAAVLVQALNLDNISFTSPLFPDHSRKFYMLGSSIPLRASVRLVPPSSRKSGAIVALNPIQDAEVVIEVNGSHAGKVLTEDEGSLTVWLSPSYGRHIAVGSFYGVSPRIQGVLVVYDFRKGLLGYEKLAEEAVSQEDVGRHFHCAYPPGPTFNFTLTLADNALQVEYLHKGAKVFCFRMPVKPTSERFLGISATNSFPCQRGVELYSLSTSIEVNTQRFVAKMTTDNAKLEGIVGQIMAEYAGALEALKPVVQVPDTAAIQEQIRELETRVGQVVGRASAWKDRYEALLQHEQSRTEGKTYFQVLGEAVTALETQLQALLQATSTLNLGAILEEYMRYQQELSGNDRQISSLVSTVQQKVGGYEEVIRKEGGMLAVYGGMGLVLSVGIYLYWSYARAKKRHDI
jgi:hypothetical protein